ncbi:hypothetical protein DFH08DRAFT_823939 [Mycena albidolilacea]|uniref:Uncharacterized protein n=1 Tax=Mycena albidolilacea TaxID=1033008 RepID=A0AAD6Z5C7_9AGAR|nr:hypothetical protein DFH08DRAFT_823939 [Mycena albidolilacea]
MPRTWNTARNRRTTVPCGIPPATRAQPCRTDYRLQPERNRAVRNRAARNSCPQPERNRAARNSRPQPECNRAAQNSRLQPQLFAGKIFKSSNCSLDICTLKALHTGFKNHPARAQSTQKCPQKCSFLGPLVPGVQHSKWDHGTSHKFFRSACGGWTGVNPEGYNHLWMQPIMQAAQDATRFVATNPRMMPTINQDATAVRYMQPKAIISPIL